MDGKVLPLNEILAIAELPSKEVLQAQVLGTMLAPITSLAIVLKAIAEGRTLIVIDHDMDSLFELAGKITVLQEGRVLVEGTSEEIKNNPLVQEAYLGGVHEEMV